VSLNLGLEVIRLLKASNQTHREDIPQAEDFWKFLLIKKSRKGEI